jgi:hypothetical protein
MKAELVAHHARGSGVVEAQVHDHLVAVARAEARYRGHWRDAQRIKIQINHNLLGLAPESVEKMNGGLFDDDGPVGRNDS